MCCDYIGKYFVLGSGLVSWLVLPLLDMSTCTLSTTTSSKPSQCYLMLFASVVLYWFLHHSPARPFVAYDSAKND